MPPFFSAQLESGWRVVQSTRRLTVEEKAFFPHSSQKSRIELFAFERAPRRGRRHFGASPELY